MSPQHRDLVDEVVSLAHTYLRARGVIARSREAVGAYPEDRTFLAFHWRRYSRAAGSALEAGVTERELYDAMLNELGGEDASVFFDSRRAAA